MNTEIVKNANISNKPMTKLQIEYFTNRIKNLTDEKRRSLESQFESEIQKVSKNNYNKFIDTLKIKAILNDFKETYNKYEATQNKEREIENLHHKEIRALQAKQEIEKEKLLKLKNILIGIIIINRKSLIFWSEIKKYKIDITEIVAKLNVPSIPSK